MKRGVQVALGLAIGAIAMAWALRGVDLGKATELIATARWRWLWGAACIFLLQQFLRAYRQMLLLRGEHPTHQYRNSLSAMCIGFFLINTIPARMGEVARPLLLHQSEKIPLGSGFAMVFTERLFDLAAAITMALATLAFANLTAVDAPWLQTMQTASARALPIIIAAMLLPMWLGAQIRTLLKPRVSAGIYAFTDAFLQSVEGLRNAGHLLRTIGLTVVIWSMSGWMYVLASRAFELGDLIGYAEGIGLLAFTMLGMAPPGAPGFAGAYEAAFIAGLQLFGLEEADRGFAFAFAFHWWTYLVQTCTALYFLSRDPITLGETWNQMRQYLRSSSE
jgi:glycosyltransferase 2 family protein